MNNRYEIKENINYNGGIYTVLVDNEADLKEGDLMFLEKGNTPLTKEKEIAMCLSSLKHICVWFKILAAHPKIEGIAEFPIGFFEDVEDLADKYFNEHAMYMYAEWEGFIDGYRKRSETHKWTDKDIEAAITFGTDLEAGVIERNYKMTLVEQFNLWRKWFEVEQEQIILDSFITCLNNVSVGCIKDICTCYKFEPKFTTENNRTFINIRRV